MHPTHRTGEFKVKTHLPLARVLLTVVSSALLILAQPAAMIAQAVAGPSLQFAPLIVMAPDDNQAPTAGPFACVDPDGNPRSTAFHCYTPADIYAAYGVDALHAEGTDGAGETIVIVDAYGSPTAQADLDRFSDTFGLPRTTIQFINPDGTP